MKNTSVDVSMSGIKRNKKQWVIGYFSIGESYSVIPLNWIVKEINGVTKCKWPNGKKNINSMLQIAADLVDENLYSMYHVQLVANEKHYDDFSQALIKLKQILDSESESCTPKDLGRGKRKKFSHKNYQTEKSDSSSDNESHEDFQQPYSIMECSNNGIKDTQSISPGIASASKSFSSQTSDYERNKSAETISYQNNLSLSSSKPLLGNMENFNDMQQQCRQNIAATSNSDQVPADFDQNGSAVSNSYPNMPLSSSKQLMGGIENSNDVQQQRQNIVATSNSFTDQASAGFDQNESAVSLSYSSMPHSSRKQLFGNDDNHQGFSISDSQNFSLFKLSEHDELYSPISSNISTVNPEYTPSKTKAKTYTQMNECHQVSPDYNLTELVPRQCIQPMNSDYTVKSSLTLQTIFEEILTNRIYMKRMIGKIDKLQTQLDDYKTGINDIHLNDEEFLTVFPFQSSDQLLLYDKQLDQQDNIKKLKTFFELIEGICAKTHIRRILTRTFSDKLAIQCSWTGRGLIGNIKLKDFIMIKLLKDVVRTKYPCTDVEFEKYVQEWFRHGKTRFSRSKGTENHTI